MRISKKAEYALRSLLAICRQPTKSWAIHELAAQERIPIKFLEQILLALRRADILRSKRGVGGGYNLVRSPGDIRLGEVIAIFDGAVSPVQCATEPSVDACSCPDPATCPLRAIMRKVRKEITNTLNAHTIEDMLQLAPSATGMAFEI